MHPNHHRTRPRYPLPSQQLGSGSGEPWLVCHRAAVHTRTRILPFALTPALPRPQLWPAAQRTGNLPEAARGNPVSQPSLWARGLTSVPISVPRAPNRDARAYPEASVLHPPPPSRPLFPCLMRPYAVPRDNPNFAVYASLHAEMGGLAHIASWGVPTTVLLVNEPLLCGGHGVVRVGDEILPEELHAGPPPSLGLALAEPSSLADYWPSTIDLHVQPRPSQGSLPHDRGPLLDLRRCEVSFPPPG
jgi:hypothetical protein